MPPATGSMRIYNVAYNKVATVARLGGRFGMISQFGMGKRDGVLVPKRNEVNKIIGTHTMCIALLAGA